MQEDAEKVSDNGETFVEDAGKHSTEREQIFLLAHSR